MHERHVEVAAERRDDLLRLVLAQQPVVDEDAGQLVADGLVHEQCGNRRIDAAAQCAKDPLATDLRTDAVDLLFDHCSGRPRRRSPGHAEQEVFQHLLPVWRVDHLRMELHAVEPARGRLERRDRRRRRAGDDLCPLGRRGHGVAVAHPDRLLVRQAVEQRTAARLPEFGCARPLDDAAELERHQLHSVADAERRDPELEHVAIHPRRIVGVHRGGPAGKDQRVRIPRPHLLRADRVRHELRIHARLAHAARDQLRVLPTEIDDEDRPLLGYPVGEPRDLSPSDSSAPPS